MTTKFCVVKDCAYTPTQRNCRAAMGYVKLIDLTSAYECFDVYICSDPEDLGPYPPEGTIVDE